MAAELEHTSISFTEEAETSLRRIVARYERRIRGRAVEEAVRARGIPAEITGSDIQKATFKEERIHRLRVGQESFPFLPDSRTHFEEDYTRSIAERNYSRKRSALERLSILYVWIGAVGLVIGLIWAPTYHLIRVLSADPTWRIGLQIAQASFAMLMIGIGVKFYAAKFRPNKFQSGKPIDNLRSFQSPNSESDTKRDSDG